MRLLDIKDKTWFPNAATSSGMELDYSDDLPQRLRQMLDKYRAIYVEKKLDGPEKFYIKLSGAERDARFSRIMELFLRDQQGLGGLGI
jgi:hypothetical protein